MAGHESSRSLRRTLQGALIGVVAAALAAVLWFTGVLDAFEGSTWDLRARLMARPKAASPLVVTILLDQYSLNWAKETNGLSWPWPRTVYGMVADFCRRGGAKALVFDVLYTEPSGYGVSDDAEFARGVAENGTVVAAMNLAQAKGQGSASAWPAEVPRPSIQVSGLDAWKPRNLSFPYAQFPIPELAAKARLLANTNLPADRADGVYRREPLFNTYDGQVVPSEALAAWMAGNPQGKLRIAPGQLTVGDLRVPIDGEGRAILRFRGPTLTHRNYTAASVLQAAQQLLEGSSPSLDPSVFRDAYVFFGFTAPGLFDLKPTPMSNAYPGVEVNATMLDNLISGDFMRPVPAPLTVALLLLLCVGAAVAVSTLNRAAMNVVAYVVFVPLAPAMAVAAYGLGAWLPMVAPTLGAALSLVGASLLSYATEGRQKRYLKGAFKQYISPAFIEELLAHPELLKLGGEKRELTIYFSDVQGFTGISEALGPEALTALLNEYLTAMTDIIQEEGGTVDKFVGDAIVAFWNAPVPQEDHAVRGVRAALRCQARLAEIRPDLKSRYGKDVYCRVGLNTGDAVVGNMGSTTRFNYTMLGDPANLASRLEGINKYFHTYTMISAMVKEKMGSAYPVRELSRVAVVGRKEPVTVYEPMQAEEFQARKPVLERFDQGLRHFYAGRFAEAAKIFEANAAADPPSEAYARKCRELAAAPPAQGWDGVWVMTEK
jgi:adenylate cyclase